MLKAFQFIIDKFFFKACDPPREKSSEVKIFKIDLVLFFDKNQCLLIFVSVFFLNDVIIYDVI